MLYFLKKKYFFYFGKLNSLTLILKKVLIFSQKCFFLYFGKWNFSKNFLFFRRGLSELEKLKKPTLKKFLIFREMELSVPCLKNSYFFLKKILIFQGGTKVFYTLSKSNLFFHFYWFQEINLL